MRGVRSSVVAAVAVLLMSVAAEPALACRGVRNWPTMADDPRIKPDETVVKATLLRAYEAKNGIRAIMGSDIDMLYRVKITDIMVNPGKDISVDDEIFVSNGGDVCEFYRPWNSSTPRNGLSSDSKILIMSKKSGQWQIRGGN